jgi:hypothetical protein
MKKYCLLKELSQKKLFLKKDQYQICKELKWSLKQGKVIIYFE